MTRFRNAVIKEQATFEFHIQNDLKIPAPKKDHSTEHLEITSNNTILPCASIPWHVLFTFCTYQYLHQY